MPEDNKPHYGITDEDYIEQLKRVDENIEARKRLRNKPGRRFLVWKKPLAILGLFILIVSGLVFSFSSYFVTDSIEVKGNKYFTSEEIIAMAHAKPGKNILYHPGKSDIKEYLSKNPYIEEVKVKRKLPSTILIEVKERSQMLAITYSDEYLILDSNGILLRKTATKPKITIASGIKVKTIKLGEELEATDEGILRNTLEIINLMNKKDVYFTKLEMSDLYIHAYVLDNLVVKGTASQLISAMEDDKLHIILETLFEKSIKRGTIIINEDGYASYQPTV